MFVAMLTDDWIHVFSYPKTNPERLQQSECLSFLMLCRLMYLLNAAELIKASLQHRTVKRVN